MSLKGLTSRERVIVRVIVDLMTHRGRRDYAHYLKIDGVKFDDLNDINTTYQLANKGWLIKPCDMLDMNPVHLTKEAWDRYRLDEWEKVQEEIMEKERGDESGSW